MNTTILLLALGAGVPADMTETFTQDFRGSGALPPVLNIFGPESSRFVKREAGGLRITLPAKRANLGAVGVSPRFAVSGDFEVSTAFEVLAVEQPSTGYGSGVNLHLMLESPKQEAITVARSARIQEGDSFFVNHSKKNAQGQVEHRMKTFPTKATAGRMGLKREGSTIHYLAADGMNSELHEIDQTDIGTEDIGVVRLAINTGGSPSLLDVRLLDLRIASDRLPNQPSPHSHSTVFWLISSGAGVALLVILSMVFYRRHRQALPQATPARLATSAAKKPLTANDRKP